MKELDRLKIPRTVWALGLVSLFMDLSSEIIHALLPLFLTATLGVSVAVVGLIDGVAESTASISKVFSGYISDRLGRRKPLILLGYSLGALSKPIFAVAGTATVVMGARFADRIGKGIRGAPRDALIADVTPLAIRGRAFGLRQTLDTIGAFVGPLLAIGLMFLFANDMRSVFWTAAIPAFIAVLLIVFGIDDREAEDTTARPPVRMRDISRFDMAFWSIVVIGVVFTLARFSEAFLVLKANAEGLPLAVAPLVLVVMNLVYSLGAYPAGVLSDRTDGRHLLISALACLVVADVILAFTMGADGSVSRCMLGSAMVVPLTGQGARPSTSMGLTEIGMDYCLERMRAAGILPASCAGYPLPLADGARRARRQFDLPAGLRRREGHRRYWHAAFTAGSLVAALAQGMTLGALLQGIKVVDRAYAGSWFDWLTPYTLLTGFGTVAGYALLGATWLVWKLDGESQHHARRLAKRAAWATFGLMAVVSLYNLLLNPAYAERWLSAPMIYCAAPVPILTGLVGLALLQALSVERDSKPFWLSLALFLMGMAGLGVTMWPYVVPPGVTIWDAAAPGRSQVFMLIGVAITCRSSSATPPGPIGCFAARWVTRGVTDAPRATRKRRRIPLLEASCMDGRDLDCERRFAERSRHGGPMVAPLTLDRIC